MSTAVHKDIRSINASAARCKPGTRSKRAAGEAYPIDKLPTQGETPIGEETLFVDEVPTAAEAGERRCYREFELDELASADESPIRDETISDDHVFEDDVDRITDFPGHRPPRATDHPFFNFLDQDQPLLSTLHLNYSTTRWPNLLRKRKCKCN
jgi:hypothetical protein